MTIPIGAPDRWDYVVFDEGQDRVYVSHGPNVTVVDGQAGAPIGTIEVGGVTHGIATVHALNKGYTDDGKAGEAVIFDLRSLKVLGASRPNRMRTASCMTKKAGTSW